MRRGTTPTHTFDVDTDLRGAEVIYITYEQCGKTVLEKTIDDIETLGEEQISVKLTQEETLRFLDRSDAPVLIQVAARWPTGDTVRSNVIRTNVEAILKEGEI